MRKINKLRIIGLMEADFNTALKLIFAKKMMSNAESSGINGEQWGGRPNRTALDMAVRKFLMLDYARLTYKTIAMFENDATSCFNGMVPGVSSLIARKFGVSETMMGCRNDTIKKLKWNIRKGCGDLEEYYVENDGDDPLSGEVQGKGDLASLWCLMSHTILKAHSTLHTLIVMKGATKGLKIE